VLFFFYNLDARHRNKPNGDTEHGGENEKKEKQVEELNDKISGYIQGFTVHGLTRVMTAPRKEAFFWFVALSCGLLMSVLVVHGLVYKYLKYEVYTEIRSIVTDKNHFPSITFCDFNLLTRSYFSFCGIPVYMARRANESQICNLTALTEPPDIYHKPNSGSWSNGLFNISACYKWDGGKCNLTQLVRSRKELNHACFTWNYEGNFYDTYSHVTLLFEYKKPAWAKYRRPHIIAVPHDPKILEIDLTKSIDLATRKKNNLNIALTHVRRKADPHPSQCINGGRELDVLPGVYARRTCAETKTYEQIYNKCGDVTDYMRPHILSSLKRLGKPVNHKNITNLKKMATCISKMKDNQMKVLDKKCPFPCNEMELATFTNYVECDEIFEGFLNTTKDSFQIELQLQNVDSYKVMEEKELYPWDQMACEIGGFLGLVMGASMLSMIEIFACTWFYGVRRALSRNTETRDTN